MAEVGVGTTSFKVRGYRNGSVVSVTWREGALTGDPPTIDLISFDAEMAMASRSDPQFTRSLALDGGADGSPLADPVARCASSRASSTA